MKRLFYFVAAVLLSCGPLPVARATNSDPSNVASTRPNEDEDQDGLTNQEEAEFGTYPYNAYSDTDSVKDGEDGWALDPDLHPPRIRNESYAIIDLGDLGFTNPIGFNNQCDILDGTLDENDPSARLWRNGQFTSIPQPNAPYQMTIRGWSWGGISDSGVCCCITTRDRRPETSRSGTVTWRWTPGSGLQMLDYHAPGFPDSRFLNNEANVKTVTASGAVLGEGWGKQITIDNHRGFNTGIRWALGATVPTLVGDLISWTYDQKTDKSTMNTTGTFFFPRGENTSGAIIGSGTVYNSSGSNGYQNAIVSNNGTLTFLSNVAGQYGSDAFSINNAPVPMILGLKEKLPFYWLLGASIIGKRLSYFDPLSDSLKNAPSSAYQVNDRFEVSGGFGLIQNGTLLDWKKKLPGYSSFWIYRINNKGCILGIGYPNGSDVPRNLLLLPVQIKVYRPQEVQEAVTWNLTRKQKVIPASEIEQKKVGIRINKDGNDGGNENDLIEVEFASTILEGFDLVIKRTSPKLKVFGSKDGTNVILDQNEVVVSAAMRPPKSYWVECTDDLPSGEIEFYIRPKSGGQDTKLKALPFRSFKTVVGALSGEVWDNAASASSQGIYKICEDLYLDGYNIHYYPESSVDRCKLEIKDQRDKCEVSDIGVFGYSHGGGSTYDTTLFMGQVNYTGYIDAIRNNFFDINPFAEERYPTGSSYHVNYYQSNWVLTNPPLAGAKTKTPGANVEVDLTSSTKHDTIDDSPIVSSGIKSTLKGKIAP